MYFGNVEIDIGNKSDIANWITVILILIIGVTVRHHYLKVSFGF